MNLMRVKLGFVALLDDPQRQILPRLYGFLRDCGAQAPLESLRGCPVGQAFSPRQYRGTRDSHRDVLRRGDVLAGLHRGRYQTVARRVWALMVSDCVELRGIAPWTGVPRVSASLRPAHTGAIRQVGDQRILALVETSVRDAAPDELLRSAAGSGDLSRLSRAKGSRGTRKRPDARGNFLSGQPRRGRPRRVLPRDDRDRDGRRPYRHAGGSRARDREFQDAG